MSDAKLKIAGFANDSITDGPGIRFTVFVQGCPHRCEGCHNPQSHDFDAGEYYTVEQILSKIKANPLLCGVTFSGGEPMCQAQSLCELAELVRDECNLEMAVYSGYTLEELLQENDPYRMKLLSLCSVLVDGRFVLAQRSLNLKFKGSTNQRILDLPASLSAKKAVILDDGRWT